MRALMISMIAALALVAGCSLTQPGGANYSRSEAGKMETVQHGTVISLRPVRIQGTRSGVGAATGAVAGGLAASGASGGKTGLVAAVIGAVAGGLLGSMTEEGMTRTDGVEIGIKMDDGREVSVVQALNPNEEFRVGDAVRVLYSGSQVRVAH
ncbi:MAG TPA: hypothetical protein VLV87_02590 [Gammaproteobacteria bacterium]|nr:hypothetical protein [Gammaproteobacteria bacterium]